MRLICLVAAVAMLASAPAFADPRTLSVIGEGTVKAAPDAATITAGVETEARHAADALSANSRAMNGVFAALKRAGIAERDMQTSGLSLDPQYSDSKGPQRITGYRASESVTVTVEDLDRLGQTIDALVASGANSVGDIAFTIRDPKPLQQQARAAAVADAMARAQTIARAAGVQLGPIQSISESGGVSIVRPMPMARRFNAIVAATPVAKGEETVQVSVSMVWEIR